MLVLLLPSAPDIIFIRKNGELRVMKRKEHEILDEIKRITTNDVYYDTGRVLSSTCTTPHEFALSVFRRYQLANLGDPGLFPGAKRIERLALQQIASLLHHPAPISTEQLGHFVTGGSEANLTALWAARNRWRKHHTSKGMNQGLIVTAESAHLSIDKAADMLGLKIVKVPLTNGYVMDVEWLQEHVNPNEVVAISATAGTTLLGAIDPIHELSDYCVDHDIWLHVDAAIGGFVFPFYPLIGRKEVSFDFKLEGVQSITSDVHKMGLCPVPGGTVIFRDPIDLENITFHLPYLLPEARTQSTVTGTRTAGAAIAFYALYQLLGDKGFAQIVAECLENVTFLKDQLVKRGLRPVIEPPMNILGVKFTTDALKRILKCMHQKKWRVAEVHGILRFVIMPHVKRDHLIQFLEDWDRCVN